MASILNPSISVGNSGGSSRPVTVSGALKFDANDVGRTYKLEIALYGDDNASDKRPTNDSSADDVIYTFKWPGLLLPRAYKTLTVQAAGTVPLSEMRMVANEALDEDKGTVKVGNADIITPVFMPRADEVFAKLTLSSASISATTPTITTGIGV